jgi:hypothetical protein
MRIIVTGQAGTQKKEFAKKLTDYILKEKRGILSSNPLSKKEIQWFEVESKEWLGEDFLTFLTDYNEKEQSKTWAKALQSINKTIQNEKTKDCFVLTHATWYRNGRFFSPVSWNELLHFQPDLIITLIDDLYDIWQRVEKGAHDTHFSLDEMLIWRSVETTISKLIATHLKLDQDELSIKGISSKLKPYFGPSIPHFIMSVKHPLETFYRLIFERPKKCPIVYASFPISRTREKNERVQDINLFRQKLQDTGAIVIDPLTIDEMRLGTDNPGWLKLRNDNQFREYQEKRWKITNPAVEPPNVYNNPFKNLSTKQIKQIAARIEQHVVDRDLRLVAQCDKLIAYRPFYPESGKKIVGTPPSTSTNGVTREITYALELRKSVWAFHPKSDWRSEQEKNFFDDLAIWSRVKRFPSKSELPKLKSDNWATFDALLEDLQKEIQTTSSH